MNKLIITLIVIFLLPLAALAHEYHPDPAQLQLMKDAYKKAQRITQDMEYQSMVETSCSSMMGSTPYKDWFMENISRLSVMTKIQKIWKEKAIADGGQKVIDYFDNEDAKLEQEIDLAKKMIASSSPEKKSRLCKTMYADADPASESSKVMESNLSFLVDNEDQIHEALNNDDNW